jgi:predicted anti-sigma-YlaC factor YlaD
MRAEHLTPDELEALARGEETEAHVLEHLEACAPCREAAREGTFATRYVRPLAGDHPNEDVLTALWSNALSPARRAEVERHTATCSRCRALLERLVRATPAETSPPLVGPGWLDETRAWAAAPASRRSRPS